MKTIVIYFSAEKGKTRKIAEELSMNEGAVKMSLLRTRKKLRQFLDEEGIYL